MATDIRSTRVASRVLSGMGSAELATTRVVLRTLSPMPSPVAVTRLSVRSLSGVDTPLAVTRAVVRSLSRQLPVDPCATPPDGEDLTSCIGPLLFTTYDPLGTGVLQAYDEVGAPDDSDYYGGRKWPWTMSLGPVRRALSDYKGNYEVGRFDVQWADPERRLRQLLATAPGKYTPGREVAAYLVSEAGRRVKVTAYLVAWGLVEGAPTYNADLSLGLSCRDVIGGSDAKWGLDGEKLIPQRLIAPPEFPEARKEVLELGVPFPVGILTDVPDPTDWPAMLMLDAGIAPPPDCQGAHVTGGGTLQYYRWVCVTAIDSAGHESPMSTWGDVHGNLEPNIAAWIAWAADASYIAANDVVKFRAYLFNTTDFDPQSNPAGGGAGGDRGPTVVVQFREKLVSDGEGGGFGGVPWGVQIASDTDGTAYTGTIPTPEYGAVTPIYVGDVTVDGVACRELLVAGCAIADITKSAYDDGTTVTFGMESDADFLIPFTAAWDAKFLTPYLDIVGADGITRRRTVIYAKGTKGDAIAAGTAWLRVDLEGVEDVGNSSGAVITDLYDQTIWFFEQLVLQNYLTGNWTCPPMFPGTSVCQVNRPSFRVIRAQRRLELAGGYTAAWVIGAAGERVNVKTWIQRICQSGQFRIGPNRFWQIKAWAVNAALDISALPHVRDPEGVDLVDGDPVPNSDHLANVLPYTYGPPYGKTTDWLGTPNPLKDTASIANYRKETPGDLLSLYCLRAAAVAAHAANQALLYSRLIPHTINPVGDLRFTVLDLGDAFLYDHYRGLGADGYRSQPFVVIGHTFLSQGRQIQLECLDVADMLTP